MAHIPGTSRVLPEHRPHHRALAPLVWLGGLIAVALAVGLVEAAAAVAPIATFLVLFQWAIGPRVVQWVIPATEIPHDGERYLTDEPAGEIVARRCRDAGVPLVRLGIVDDDVPNALTFGRTRRDARVWVTRGLLERLDHDEIDAVVAHEIGHVRHRDFILMTVASVVPLLLYVLARTLIDAGGDNDGGEIALVGLAVLVLYFISQFIVLWLSRAREFAADHWSCESTGNGDALVSALVKIAYGMTASATPMKTPTKTTATAPTTTTTTTTTTTDMTKAARRKAARSTRRLAARRARSTRLMHTMGILDDGAAAGMVNGFVGGIDAERAVAALQWETTNPWARLFEKLSTHPLVGRRIAALERSGLPGRPRWLGLHVAETQSTGTPRAGLRRAFLTDLAAVVVPWLALAVSVLMLLDPAGPTWQSGVLLAGAGVLFALAQVRRYPFEFAAVEEVTTLLERIDAGPVRGIPVVVRGRIVGRATPGYVLSADLVLQDGSGIVALGYRQPIPGANALFGFRKAKDFVGHDVVARGWYRRTPYPVIELRDLGADDGRKITPRLWLARFVIAGCLVVAGLAVTTIQLARV